MRLIDADAIFPWYVEAFKGGVEPRIEPHDMRFSMLDIKMNLSNIPTIDAVPVTRCKNCRHFKNKDENYVDEYGNFYSTCIYMPEASDTDFCSKAERKEE